MNPSQQRALGGFVLGALGLAALQAFTGREAAKLGLPHAAAGLVAAVIAHEAGF